MGRAARPPAVVVDDGSLELAGGGRARAGRDAVFGHAPKARSAAWRRLEAETGIAWSSWDLDTEVPSRILLSGVEAPGVMADPAAAAAFAKAFLARHIDLLAPGASLGDFVLVANEAGAGMRTVGFTQHHRGMRVLGGQVSFRFKNDRLIAIGSEAFPDVHVSTRTHGADPDDAVDRARAFVQDDLPGRLRSAAAATGPFVLPVVDRSGRIAYHEVLQTEVELDAPRTRFTVWVDAETGDPIARRSTLHFGTTQVLFNVPVQHPNGPRFNGPARSLNATVGAPATTDDAGVISYAGASAAFTTDGVGGPLVDVQSATGPNAAAGFTATDGGTIVWSASGDEIVDAQLSAFIHASTVKDYVRTIDPSLAWLDGQLPVTVNIDDVCNAFSDGNGINFYLSGDGCENTGRLADVVYHEFGHSVHAQSLIVGVGEFNGSLSEGVSDYLAATMTGSSELGVGFFQNDTPLRDFDPSGFEYRWPEDRGEVHDEGRIIGGALWDLRKLMVAKLGPTEGVAYTDTLWYETTRRAVDIPSMYAEALAFDDDDGNLANGTPNGCEINAAYGPHGLFTAGEANERVTVEQIAEGTEVQLALQVPVFPACPVDAAPVMQWRIRDDDGAEQSVSMELGPDGIYRALIPAQTPGTVVQYRVRLNYSNGSEGPRPDNFVDPWYETFIGEVIPLRCLGEPWGTEITGNVGSDWVVGPFDGDLAGSDPKAPFDMGDHLYQPGWYLPGSDTTITFDDVQTLGHTNVRLQYWRWLTVEDGFFDQASILADDVAVWNNYGSSEDFLATFHHVDKEWRFHDVDLSDFVDDGSVSVGFSLTSDQGLFFGGWTVAAMCVVAFDENLAICGDGVVDPGEQCDDGNLIPGDGCSDACILEEVPGTTGTPPPTTVGPSTSVGPGDETGENGDTDSDTDGAELDGDGLIDRGCACSARGPADAWLGFALVGLLGLVRRRRTGSIGV